MQGWPCRLLLAGWFVLRMGFESSTLREPAFHEGQDARLVVFSPDDEAHQRHKQQQEEQQ